MCEYCVRGFLKLKRIRIKTVSFQENLVIKDLSTCRLCEFPIDKYCNISLIEMLTKNGMLEIFRQHFPELDLEKMENPIICSTCQTSLVDFNNIVSLLNCSEEEKFVHQLSINIDNQCILENKILNTEQVKIEESEDIKLNPVSVDSSNNYVEHMNTDSRDELRRFGIKQEIDASQNISYEDFKLTNDDMNIKSDPTEFEGLTEKLMDSVQHEHHPSVLQSQACSVCSFQGNCRQVLKRHMMTHKNRNEEMHMCKLCDFRTPHRYDFRKHTSSEHKSDSGMYTCHKCSYQSKLIYSVKIHMLKHQDLTETEMHKCHLCNFKSKLLPSVKRHMLIHKKPSELKMHTCSVCPFETKHAKSIKSHLLTHLTSDNLHKFKCDVCHYETKYLGNLKRHMACHRNLAEAEILSCNSCSFQSKNPASVKRHMLRHRKPSEIRMRSCLICSFQTRYLTSLKTHMETEHNSDKILNCSVCNFETKLSPDIEITWCNYCNFKLKKY